MAVYTPLSEAQIADFLVQYPLGVLARAQGISEGIENTNYLLVLRDHLSHRERSANVSEQGEGEAVFTPSPDSSLPKGEVNVILTLFEKRVNPQDLPFYMAFMAHLAAKGLPCPQPFAGHDGQVIRSLAGRPAVLVEFLAGQGSHTPNPAHVKALGAQMARMHLAVQDFPLSRANDFSPHCLGALYAKTALHLDSLEPGLRAALAAEIEALQCWPTLGLPQGVIHADLFPDNVFFAGEQLTGVIDFYFSATDYFAYDIAIVLNAWDCVGDADRTAQLLAGYEAIRPLTPAERAALPLLARGAALRFLLTRAHDWFFRVEGALVTPKDPMEYLRKWKAWAA